jgi:hypothetical protein
MTRRRCNASEHLLSRRTVLGGLLGGAALSFGHAPRMALAEELRRSGKRLLIVYQAGGPSQLETWDPKPGAVTAGPHLTIPTTVPGTHICELLPHTARQAHRLTIVRSMSTGENNHGPAAVLLLTGRRQETGLPFPEIGCVTTRFLTPPDHPVPGFVSIAGDGMPAFLGARHAPVLVSPAKPPANIDRPALLDVAADERRQALRRRLDQNFRVRRGTAETEAWAHSFDQAWQLMGNRRLFDLTTHDPREIDRYGPHEFGRSCLLARRLLEEGVTAVKVTHAGYDTHAENFNLHLDLLDQFDRSFAALIEDLDERGLLAETVVVVLGEFGRTPQINHRMGRDHWSHSWSLALAGGPVPRGAVIGKTSEDGTEVIEDKIDAACLFHTMLLALGLDPADHWTVGGQEVPIGDPAGKPLLKLIGA